MGKYFSKFPAIDYNGHIAKNIMARAKIISKAKSSGITFYDYSVPEEMRADVVSTEYYDNPDYAWLIYLANDILDPYHDYYLSDNSFKLNLISKYGSLNYAYNTIHSWVLSWSEDQRELTPVQYEALPGNLKKFWNGILQNAYSPPYKYVRKREATSIDTNRLVIIPVQDPSIYKVGAEYEGKDLLDNDFFGIVKSVGKDRITLVHVVGTVSGNSYVGIPNSIVDISNIPGSESGYWIPMSVFDYEATINAENKMISIIDKQMAYKMEKDLKKVLNS